MQLSDISVRRFMAALFNKDLTGLNNWEELYMSFIDLSGMGESRESALMVGIHNIQVRLTVIEGFINYQTKFLQEFDMPFEQGFDDIKCYGHRLTWDAGNPGAFLKQMKLVESKENKNISQLDVLYKELKDLRENGHKADSTSRADFVRMLNTLNKAGFTIDKDKTDMEELSLMIKDYNAEQKLNNKG